MAQKNQRKVLRAISSSNSPFTRPFILYSNLLAAPRIVQLDPGIGACVVHIPAHRVWPSDTFDAGQFSYVGQVNDIVHVVRGSTVYGQSLSSVTIPLLQNARQHIQRRCNIYLGLVGLCPCGVVVETFFCVLVHRVCSVRLGGKVDKLGQRRLPAGMLYVVT